MIGARQSTGLDKSCVCGHGWAVVSANKRKEFLKCHIAVCGDTNPDIWPLTRFPGQVKVVLFDLSKLKKEQAEGLASIMDGEAKQGTFHHLHGWVIKTKQPLIGRR